MSPTPTLYATGHGTRTAGDRARRPLVGGALYLDFVNTTPRHEQPDPGDELSPGYVNLLEWAAYAGVIDEPLAVRLRRAAEKDPREAAAVRRRAIALREALRAIARALAVGEEPVADHLACFNEEARIALANGAWQPEGNHLAWRWEGGAALDRMLWLVVDDAARRFGDTGMARVRACAAPGCQRLFLDTSRNGSRQFCDPATCGTATRVRRFRERQRERA